MEFKLEQFAKNERENLKNLKPYTSFVIVKILMRLFLEAKKILLGSIVIQILHKKTEGKLK